MQLETSATSWLIKVLSLARFVQSGRKVGGRELLCLGFASLALSLLIISYSTFLPLKRHKEEDKIS